MKLFAPATIAAKIKKHRTWETVFFWWIVVQKWAKIEWGARTSMRKDNADLNRLRRNYKDVWLFLWL